MSTFIPNPGLIRMLARNPILVARLWPWARVVQRRAIAKAPVRTGRLRSRIRIVSDGRRLRVISDAANPKDGFVYAAKQERRRPYLRPAVRK